jgi:hypothetical protein
MGQPIVTQVAPYTVAGCAQPPPVGPPCVSAQWVMGALRVRSLGQPVVLQSSPAVCLPTGTPLTVVVAQLRVKAQ